MRTLDHILNWTLKVGSHPFPGPDGGTCINEAALVAAGFEYRPIHSVSQMPRCFSRPICRFAMLLNDSTRDNERQRLLPFVTRLACADTPEIEDERQAYIQSRMPRWTLNIEKGIEILEGALAIGRRADPLVVETARTRLEVVRGKPVIDTPEANSTPFGKVTAWLPAKKALEPAD